MAKESKKIIIDDLEEGADLESQQDIKVKKSKGWQNLVKRSDQVEDEVEKFYNSQEFNHLQKPTVIGLGRSWLILLMIVVFGLILGGLSIFFILTRTEINFLGTKIDLAKYFPTQEITVVTEKKVTVTNDVRLAGLIQDLNTKTFRIFKTKLVPENEPLLFLEQIYAPWQIMARGLVISADGWLITAGNLDSETSYVAINDDNLIFSIEEIIIDSITDLKLVKILAENLEPVKFSLINEITPGRQVIIVDKFNNLNLTSISRIKARNIYQTEDLVRSTDRLTDFLRLDSETSMAFFPNAFIFGLDGRAIGLIMKEKVVPFWFLADKLEQVLHNKKFNRPYLGIDYLRIEEAPGLTSPLFKNFSNGAIVYGPPVADSPAAQADVKNADVIIKFNDITLDRDQDLTDLVQEKNPGDIISLTILRKGEKIVIQVELGELQ